MKKLKILVCIEAVLGAATLISLFATRNSTDFSGFIVAYLVIAMILVAIPTLAIALTEVMSSKNNKAKLGAGLIILLVAVCLFLGYIF